MRITSSLDRWVAERRGPKRALNPQVAHAAWWEEERDASGNLAATAVVLLTNTECPFRCLMCDLWVNTLDGPVGRGNVPRQIRAALAALPPARHIKLYNAGSFFDPDAIPPEDDEDIAGVVAGYARVIVESHPAFLRGSHADRVLRFRDALRGRLEIAIGLETAHPATLARLNKRMTLDSFARAAAFLAQHDVALRVFVLLRPPFMTEEEGMTWACRSLDLAFDCGATACAVIPTRGGNGAMEALDGAFTPPALASLERVVEYGVRQARGRVFADLWDAERLIRCACGPARVDRLRQLNRHQQLTPPVVCGACDG